MMPGSETVTNVGGWTVETLHGHLAQELARLQEFHRVDVLRLEEIGHRIERVVADEKARTDDRFREEQAQIDRRFGSERRFTDETRRADERVLDAMTKRIDERLYEANRFRQQIEAERGTFLTRDEFRAFEKSYDESREMVSRSLALREGQSRGFSQTGALIVAGLGAVLTILTIVVVVSNFATG